jgi:hypothetical protein
MDKDASKSGDQRGGNDRRQDQDPAFPGPERREGDRRNTGKSAPK